jgi:2-polyprenyl-3-methyl-5-hydroxy-6-metoxy-1,4-benzoquinol methylase
MAESKPATGEIGFGRISVSRVADDSIYTGHTLHSVPHRIRVRQVISELRAMPRKTVSYADVGCGGGSITQRIVEVIQPSRAAGYDSNPDLIDAAANLFPDVSFRVWNLTQNPLPGETYDLVTCLETLEHIEDYESALSNLLKITAGTLLITVPIELGLLGAAKFSAKALLGRKPLGSEHSGSSFAYLKTLLTAGDISRFRVHSNNGFWVSHTGFDYRMIDNFLKSRHIDFSARNRGWNRFYRVSVRTSGVR